MTTLDGATLEDKIDKGLREVFELRHRSTMRREATSNCRLMGSWAHGPTLGKMNLLSYFGFLVNGCL